MLSSDEVRELLSELIEKPISTVQWNNFVETYPRALESYMDRLANPEEDDMEALSRLAELFQNLAERSPRKRRVVQVEPGDDQRWKALAEILTIRARRDPDVAAFRNDVLKNNLVKLNEIQEWIRKTAKRDGAPTRFVPNHESRSDYRKPPDLIRYVTSVATLTDRLAYPIRIGGRLSELRDVARRLTQGFGWPEEWAVTFVLTDEQPIRPLIFGYTTNKYASTRRDERFHSSQALERHLQWVELRVNPYAVSPSQLQKVYSEIRKDLFDILRIDAVDGKRAALAVHWEKTKDESAGTRRAEWNRLYSNWKYTSTSDNFLRDSKSAHQFVTGERRKSSRQVDDPRDI